MKVSDVMTKSVITISTEETIEDAARKMLEENVGGLPVVDDQNRLVGIITESDFIGKKVEVPHAPCSIPELFGEWFHDDSFESILKEVKSKKVGEVMTSPVLTVKPDSTLTAAVTKMMNQQTNRLPVVENDKVVGIISRRDVLKTTLKAG